MRAISDAARGRRGHVEHGEYPELSRVECVSEVCANIGEAWCRRRYKAHFVSKLSDAESEAEETQVWLEFAFRCGYLEKTQFDELDDIYDKVIAQLVRMLSEPGQWSIR